MAGYAPDQAGRRLDSTGSSYGHEEGARIECLKNQVQVVGHFAEPADVGPNLPAAMAARKVGRQLVGLLVVKWFAIAAIATAFEQFAVHVNHVLGTSLFVQAVHILRAEKQTVL